MLILIHELGHYYFARRAGVRVDEFGFGLPPRLWGKKIGETMYSINLFPFGGFVRLFGENPEQPGAVTDPRSFNAKTLRQRFAIVIAGVGMNLILAILLLIVGFWFGIKPLILDSQDVLQALSSGHLQVQSGFTIQRVAPDSLGQKLGLQPGDIFVGINGSSIIDTASLFTSLKDASSAAQKLRVRRGDSIIMLDLPKTLFQTDATSLGLTLYDSFVLPRVSIQGILPNTEVARSGLKSQDILLSVNGTPIYTLQDFQSSFLTQKTLRVTYEREFKSYEAQLTFPQRNSVILSEVIPASAAAKADFRKGDVILQLQRTQVNSPEEVITLLQQARQSGQPAQFLIDRHGTFLTLYVSPGNDGTYGLQLAPIVNQDLGMTVAGISIPTSILELRPVSYSFLQSVGMGFTETYRLAKTTVSMFGSLVTKIFSKFEVPEGVAGPVGIAQMTGTFVQEGFLSVIRFMAMLSLSLAILNLLPFPGLDGGRLLFIIIEMVLGRPLNRSVEQVIHAIGAIFLIILILAVTYKDIIRIVG